jgi:hypothetical protein
MQKTQPAQGNTRQIPANLAQFPQCDLTQDPTFEID